MGEGVNIEWRVIKKPSTATTAKTDLNWTVFQKDVPHDVAEEMVSRLNGKLDYGVQIFEYRISGNEPD